MTAATRARRMVTGRRFGSAFLVSGVAVLVTLGWSPFTSPPTPTSPSSASSSTSLQTLFSPAMAMAQDADGRLSPIDELLALYEKAMKEIDALKIEVGQLRLETAKATRERDELKLFIKNHDAYGTAFEKYAISEEAKLRAAIAEKAAEVRAKRDEKKRRLQALRAERIAERQNRENGKVDQDTDPWAKRAKAIEKAGYRRIGDFVFVGQMGYVYKTETETEYRYSPFLQGWYTDEHKDVDYSKMTLSGSLMHATDGMQDLSIALAFYDENGGQIGQTTVRVDGARPGVPYPFTSELQMAADVPFADYTAWVLYADATPVAPMLPTTTGSAGMGGGSGRGSDTDMGTDAGATGEDG